MADIIAIKIVNGKTLKQRFSEHAWNLIGKDKNGWVETSSQTIENTIESQKIIASGKAQIIQNAVGKEKDQVISDISTAKKDVDSEKSEAFMKAIEGLSKSIIKDFFDSAEVKYNNKSSMAELKIQLAEHLNYDIVKLQEFFQ